MGFFFSFLKTEFKLICLDEARLYIILYYILYCIKLNYIELYPSEDLCCNDVYNSYIEDEHF